MKNLVARMKWLRETRWGWNAEALWVQTEADTDYWQRTHYGFRRDNAHALVGPVTGDFRLRARFAFAPNAQYDQCGLLVRADAECWFKCSVEYETETLSRLGSVVTNAGYSDWATQDVSSATRTIWYEALVQGLDLTARYSLDGEVYRQMRVAHLAAAGPLVAGIYGCSPTGGGFRFEVAELSIEPLADGTRDPQV